METTTWWFGIEDEDSDLFGEEFFVEVTSTFDCAKEKAINYAKAIFPTEKPVCYGGVSAYEAEMMGLDTY